MKEALKRLARPVWRPVRARMEHLAHRATNPLSHQIVDLKHQISTMGDRLSAMEDRLNNQPKLFIPDPLVEQLPADTPFMEYSSCTARDFFHPRFAQLSKLMGRTPLFHRKYWEWIFISHHLIESGVVAPGKKGLVFGVGSEMLPALFASLGASVHATDAPPDLAGIDMWGPNGQHGSSIEQLRNEEIIPYELFKQRVTHGFCDMNNIDPSLVDYDFNWSSCCFEHLGSLEAGMQFVINAVEKTLKPGGIAIHTTELNMSSNEDTIGTGSTVIYHRRDLEELIARLTERGHKVDTLKIGPAAHALDFHVDTPPYAHFPHLKIHLAGYTTTSVGLVIRRG